MTAWDQRETLKVSAIDQPHAKIWAIRSETPAQRIELQSRRATRPIPRAEQTPENRFTSQALLPSGKSWKSQDPIVQSG